MVNIDLQSGPTIHYSDHNQNGHPVVLLLHGLGVNSDSWQLQIPALTKAGFRILAPDLRGFGRSSYPGGSCNPVVMAEDMATFMNSLAISSSHIIGISMGGTVALQLALMQPTIVESLILTNTFAKLRPRKFYIWIFYAVRLLLVHLIGINKQADFVARRLFPEPKQEQLREIFKSQVKQANPHGYRSTMRSYVRYDLSDQINSIDVPALVITGERDSIVSPEVQIEMAEKIPKAEHVFISDAGHAVSVEQPEEYNRIVLKFLEENIN
jgi:pimeloyl-ACP methyl ester carboxylesterase